MKVTRGAFSGKDTNIQACITAATLPLYFRSTDTISLR